jgi:hypothetical protein
VYHFFTSILAKTTIANFLSLLEERGYKQVIKSKTRQTETSIITQDVFFELTSALTDVKLSETELAQLRQCVQLTPKFSHLFTLKLLTILISEVELQQQQ